MVILPCLRGMESTNPAQLNMESPCTPSVHLRIQPCLSICFCLMDTCMQCYFSVTNQSTVHCLIPSRHVGRAPGCYPFSNAVQFPSVDAYPKCISSIPYVWLYCHAWGYVRSCTCFYKRKRRGSREDLIFFSVRVYRVVVLEVVFYSSFLVRSTSIPFICKHACLQLVLPTIAGCDQYRPSGRPTGLYGQTTAAPRPYRSPVHQNSQQHHDPLQGTRKRRRLWDDSRCQVVFGLCWPFANFPHVLLVLRGSERSAECSDYLVVEWWSWKWFFDWSFRRYILQFLSNGLKGI